MFAITRNAPICPELRFKESASKFAYQQLNITDLLKLAIYSKLSLFFLFYLPSLPLSIYLSLSLSITIADFVATHLGRPQKVLLMPAAKFSRIRNHTHTSIVCALLSVPNTHTQTQKYLYIYKYSLKNTLEL